MFYIYAVQNKVTDKVYVGQSVSGEKRLKQHRYGLNKGNHCNPALQGAWNKYGADAFDLYILDSRETREEIWEAEQWYIRWYRSLGLSYNLTDGGEGGTNPSEETLAKYRARTPPMAGKQHSEESKQLMAQAKLGIPRGPQSEEHTAKIAEANRAGWTDEKRQEMSERKKGNTYFEGKSHSEETKQAMSESRKGELNPQFGKPSSEAQKQAASKTWKGVKRGPMSEDTKQKLREARALQPRVPCSDATKEKIRQRKLERDAAKKA